MDLSSHEDDCFCKRCKAEIVFWNAVAAICALFGISIAIFLLVTVFLAVSGLL